MEREERLKSELAFQADRAARVGRVDPTPRHVIERYRRAGSWRLFPSDFLFAHLKDIRARDVLDFGCGDGALSVVLARLGARVTALDISPELIAVARRRAAVNEVADRIRFVERDVTVEPLPADRFDFAICNLVLHHVDLRAVVPRIVAALKAGGTAVIVEPIAFSPWLQWVRDRVPITKRASPGERPLNRDEVSFVLDAGLLRHDVLNFHPLTNAATTAIARADFLRFQLDEIERAQLSRGEEEDLELEADLESCNRLCRRVHGHDRDGELREAMAQGTATLVQRDGRVTGYATAIGFLGHAVGEANKDLRALIGSAGAFSGPGFLVPMRNAALLRWDPATASAPSVKKRSSPPCDITLPNTTKRKMNVAETASERSTSSLTTAPALRRT